MKYIVYILLFFPVWVTAQTYKYIGIEDGLSNRRIFNIQKDACLLYTSPSPRD